MPDELEELFPDLQQTLSRWGRGASWSPEGNGETPPEHAGVTDEDIERYLQTHPEHTQFRSGQGAPPPVGGVEDQAGEEVGESVETPVETPPQEAPDEVVFGDQRIPRARVEAYERFNELVQSDQRLQGLLDNYLRFGRIPPELVGEGQAAPPTSQPAPTTPEPRPDPNEPPPGLDLDDPAIRALWERQQSLERTLNERIQSLDRGVQETVSQQERQAQAQHEAIVNRGVTSFKQQYGLNDQEMQSVHDAAARLNVLPSLVSGIDPITGAPVRPDPLSAVERSLEIAYYMMPQFRNRAFNTYLEQRVKDNDRKRKLGALAGSSGSVPRSQPAPTNETERQDALRREVAEMFSGTWSAPE